MKRTPKHLFLFAFGPIILFNYLYWETALVTGVADKNGI